MTRSESSPLFSVVMPTFNRADRILQAVRSVQRQSLTDWELLIVDDGSTDDTRLVLASALQQDSRIRLMSLQHNSGLPAVARNYGIGHAKGRYVAFLDSDDTWWSSHLRLHAERMGQMGGLGLCYSHLWNRRQHLPLYGLLLLPSPPQQVQSRETLLRRNSIQCSAVSCTRELLIQVGGFNASPTLRAVEDYELWLRLASVAPMSFIRRLTGVYQSNSGISMQLDMEEALRNLSHHINERVGRRRRPVAILERTWGIPWALASFGSELAESSKAKSSKR